MIDTIICGHNVDVLAGFAPASINLTVTSPPYDGLRTYNGYTFDFEGVAQQLYHVTKPGGVVVWVVADATVDGSETGTSFRQALYFKEIGFNLHDTMIYHKSSAPPQEQHPRYKPAFEYMFVFCKGWPPRVFNPIKRANKLAGKMDATRGQRKTNNELRHAEGKIKIIKDESVVDNVWSYVPTSVTGHVAPFPERLAEDHILSWSNPGDVVLDPFVGSGTTAKMAIKHHRHYIGIDVSPEYCALARRRIAAVQPTLFEVAQ